MDLIYAFCECSAGEAPLSMLVACSWGLTNPLPLDFPPPSTNCAILLSGAPPPFSRTPLPAPLGREVQGKRKRAKMWGEKKKNREEKKKRLLRQPHNPLLPLTPYHTPLGSPVHGVCLLLLGRNIKNNWKSLATMLSLSSASPLTFCLLAALYSLPGSSPHFPFLHFPFPCAMPPPPLCFPVVSLFFFLFSFSPAVAFDLTFVCW